MNHPIPRRTIATRIIALAVVVGDFLYHTGPILPLTGLVMILCLNDCAPSSLGMKWAPTQGWRYWCRLAIWFGAAIGILLLVYVGVCLLMKKEIPVYRTAPHELSSQLFFMCVYAPAAEEVVYRSLLATAILPTAGHYGTILISGLVFAMIHVRGGNASPENQIAGFLLAWAFLKSETILVPIAMHSAGNLIALASHIAAWYWFPEGQASFPH
jgi:membrane protease YdiL (CAAX protease family)